MRNIKLTKVAAMFAVPLIVFAAPSYAASTGNDLLEQCSAEKNSFKSGICFGYTSGLYESMRIHAFTCARADVTYGEIREVIVQYLEKNPGIRNGPAAYLASAAIVAAFDCKPITPRK